MSNSSASPMTSETIEMGGGDGKEQLLIPPPPTGDGGKVVPVNSNDVNAIRAAKFAAKQNGVEFKTLVLGYAIIFPQFPFQQGLGPFKQSFYHLKIVAKDSDGDSKAYFTIVGTIPEPVLLLFTPSELSS